METREEYVTERKYIYSEKIDRSIDNDLFDNNSKIGKRDMEKSYSRHRSHLDYVQDEWEKSPKTGYTYAKSASYNKNYDEHYIHPNMSRPSIRGDRSDESSLLDQSDCTDVSVKYHLRSRDVLDLTPTSEENKFLREVNNRRVDMIDRQNSPLMHATFKTFSDGSSSRMYSYERKNIFATILTLTWAIVTFPLRKIGLIADVKQTKRCRQSPNSSNHHGNDTQSHSTNHYTTNFLYVLIGTIGGIFNVIRNIFVHLFETSAKASAAVNEKVLNKKKKGSCHSICYPLIIITLATIILGGGYLYACGNYSSSVQVYGDVKNVLSKYSSQSLDYANETYLYLWEYLALLFKQNSHTTTTTDSSTPIPSNQSQPPKNVNQSQIEDVDQSQIEDVNQSLPGDTTPTQINCQDVKMTDFEERLNELRKSLQDLMEEKWKLFDAQIKLKVGDVSTVESLKYQGEIEKFKEEFYFKVEELKESIKNERHSRMTSQSKRFNEENEQIERLQVNLRESMDILKVEMTNKVEEGQRDVIGRLEVIGAASANRIAVGEDIKRSIELHLHEAFSEPRKLSGLLLWLSEKFVTDEEMERRMDLTVEKIMMEQVSKEVKGDEGGPSRIEEEMNKLKGEMTSLMEEMREEFNGKVKVTREQSSLISDVSTDATITREWVKQAIKEALSTFDADKTGKTDYALESAGGSVLGTRCSKTYRNGMAQLSVFGIPLWYANNSPRTVIQPGSLPGECWPFIGSIGHIVIQLSTKIHITEVSLEHVNVNITTFRNADSAPKKFAIWGLADANDQTGICLGEFTYDLHKEPIQSFPIAHEFHYLSFLHVELRILSNHGNKDYTCLYRFRVHGIPDRSHHDDNVDNKRGHDEM